MKASIFSNFVSSILPQWDGIISQSGAFLGDISPIGEIQGTVSELLESAPTFRMPRLFNNESLDRARRFLQPTLPGEDGTGKDFVQAGFPLFIGVAVALHALGAAALALVAGDSASSEKAEEKLSAADDMALEALKHWDQDPHAKLDFAKFFLELGTSGPPPLPNEDKEQIFKAWIERDQSIQGDPQNITTRRNALYWAYFQRYGRDLPSLVSFLQGKRGNCVACTELLVADLMEKIELPPHQILLVQVFQDHLQPVIWDKNSGEFWNLVSGEKTKKVVADLYHPAIFFAARLRKQGISLPFSESKLLVLPADPKDIQKGEAAKIPLSDYYQFPPSEAAHGGPVPEEDLLPLPVDENSEIDSPEKETNPEPDALDMQVPATSPADGQVLPIKAWDPAKALDDNSRLQLNSVGFALLRNQDGSKQELIFRDADLVERYQRLDTDKERKDFLIKLTHVGMAQFARSPHFQTVLSFFSVPEQQIQKLELHALDQVRDLLLNSDVVLRGAYKDIIDLFPRSDRSNTLFLSGLWEKILGNNSLWKQWDVFRQKWLEKISGNPREFWLLTNHLSPEKRVAWLFLAQFADRFGEPSKLKSLLLWISDPTKVGIAEGKAAETSYFPMGEEISVEFLEPVPSQASMPLLGKLEPKAPSTRERPEIQLSSRCFMDTILLFSHYPHSTALVKRWTLELSTLFRKVHPSQSFEDDLSFLYLVHRYLGLFGRFYSPEQRMKILPPHMALLYREIISRNPNMERRALDLVYEG